MSCPGHHDLPRIGFQEAHDLLQRNGLAHSGTAQNAKCLPRLDRKADIVQHVNVAKGFRHVFEGDIRPILLPGFFFSSLLVTGWGPHDLDGRARRDAHRFRRLGKHSHWVKTKAFRCRPCPQGCCNCGTSGTEAARKRKAVPAGPRPRLPHRRHRWDWRDGRPPLITGITL